MYLNTEFCPPIENGKNKKRNRKSAIKFKELNTPS